MATVVSTPVLAYYASPVPASAMAQSSNATVAISCGGFELQVPFFVRQPNTANISAGWEAYAYRSTDAGATYETIASVSFSVARNPNIADTKTIRLDAGYWLLRVITGGNVAATWSFYIGTAEVLTAIQNV